jgi:RNA polymerase sigma-70 factor (ECF subfamily)
VDFSLGAVVDWLSPAGVQPAARRIEVAMTSPDRRHLERFPTTHWSLIGRAGTVDPAVKRQALGELLTRYMPAIKAYLTVKRHVAPDQVDDLFQGFVTSKVLEQDLIAHADRHKGKFRTWLLTALDRYVISDWRHRSAVKRGGRGGESLSTPKNQGLPAATASAPEVFDLAWARALLAEVLRRMRAECEESGTAYLWGVFESRVLVPTLEGAPPLPYNELVARFGFASPVQASNALITAKRTFARILRAVIAEYAGADEFEAELRDLQQILARAGAGS